MCCAGYMYDCRILKVAWMRHSMRTVVVAQQAVLIESSSLAGCFESSLLQGVGEAEGGALRPLG